MQRSNSNATSSGVATMAWDGAHCQQNEVLSLGSL